MPRVRGIGNKITQGFQGPPVNVLDTLDLPKNIDPKVRTDKVIDGIDAAATQASRDRQMTDTINAVVPAIDVILRENSPIKYR